ncbi:ABC transporter substrate-binding protein [Paenibacillus sp. MSJ-34]|uniref:ABC transporter substrate-binding protein n=1 Tax=Paenibacillus sp. MSJ-34 TaxID=2841529 RepID=UPI001C12948E|nr:extracellular solute-binding protein [Paenibacillus sp. MSJ-34]MBU5440558.1 extracellular solute-binding protein [Paenibacillus sp. MSJ-34]
MTNRKLFVRKLITVCFTLTLLVPLLAACTGSKGGDDNNKERVLRIGTVWNYGGDDSYLRQQYTDIFEYANPNIKIEFVGAIDNSDYMYTDPNNPPERPDELESMKKLLTGANPVDVVMLDSGMYKKLVNENMLQQLDPLIQKDKYDITDFVPTVIDGIKDLGDSNLYGLAPTFGASALFYNKQMFLDAGIPAPQDNMTWDDIFDLARRISTGEGENRQFGIQLNRWGGDPWWDLNTYMSALQLRTFDDKAEKMTVDTPGWEKAWSTIAKLSKDKIMPNGRENFAPRKEGVWNRYDGDNFLSSRVAMTIADYGYITELIDANKNVEKIDGMKKVDWDVVTMPTHPEAPGIGGNIYLSNIMAINAKAQNPDDAWAFVKFLNSPEWAKLKSRSSYELVSRKSFIQPREGLSYNTAAFYTLKPLPPVDDDNELYRKYENLWQVTQKGQEYFQQVIEDKKTSAEALKEWQAKGDAMLQELKKDPKKQFDMGGGMETFGTVYSD